MNKKTHQTNENLMGLFIKKHSFYLLLAETA